MSNESAVESQRRLNWRFQGQGFEPPLLSGPKARPTGVVDGQPVDIWCPGCDRPLRSQQLTCLKRLHITFGLRGVVSPGDGRQAC